MLKNRIIYAWVLVYLFVMGCVVWPRGGSAAAGGNEPARAPATGRSSTEGMPYRGVVIQVQRVDWIDRYKQCIDEVAALGADTVSLVVDTRMENGDSSRIWIDLRMSPSAEQLGALIDHAKARNLRVMLMPIVLLDNPRHNEWRGTIKPESWSEWFQSYRSVMSFYAWVAESHGVDILVVGSELVSTEDKLEEWTRTIREVRRGFNGKLTYSSNWDHYVGIPFWDQLDFIAMNSYWKLGKGPSVTVSEINAKWKDIQQDLIKFKRKTGKPLLFTEVGWCSLDNAAHEPWDYTRTTEALNLDLQKRLWQGFFESWHGNAELGGFMIWEWPPENGGPNDKGYIPKGKPAEQVIRQWLAKPKWSVR
jgi:hypothetical protein